MKRYRFAINTEYKIRGRIRCPICLGNSGVILLKKQSKYLYLRCVDCMKAYILRSLRNRIILR